MKLEAKQATAAGGDVVVPSNYMYAMCSSHMITLSDNQHKQTIMVL